VSCSQGSEICGPAPAGLRWCGIVAKFGAVGSMAGLKGGGLASGRCTSTTTRGRRLMCLA
jgi:hypothetical protein